MVEAAIVFPIVILTAMTLLYMALSLYAEAENVSKLHLSMRTEAGILSQTWENENSEGDLQKTFETCGYLTEKHLEGVAAMSITTSGIINTQKEKEYVHREWIINEERFVRWLDVGKKVLLQF